MATYKGFQLTTPYNVPNQNKTADFCAITQIIDKPQESFIEVELSLFENETRFDAGDKPGAKEVFRYTVGEASPFNIYPFDNDSMAVTGVYPQKVVIDDIRGITESKLGIDYSASTIINNP